jgi:arylformamidase
MHPAERFIGRGRYIDVWSGYDLSAIRSMDIGTGDIVLLHTGMSSKYHESTYFTNYPVIPSSVALFFANRGISMVGMDMCGPDYEPFPVHKILLSADVLILENLTNLSAISVEMFTVSALPIRLDLDGAPARVIASW